MRVRILCSKIGLIIHFALKKWKVAMTIVALCVCFVFFKIPLIMNSATNWTTTDATMHPNSLQNEDKSHLALISATLYQKSKLYEPNSVVLLFVGPDQPSSMAGTHLWAKTLNSTHSSVDTFAVRAAYERQTDCKWTTYFAVFRSVEQPTLVHLANSGIQTSADENFANIYLRSAFAEKSGQVGICFSPLFYAEHWQLFVTSVEIWRHHGADLQIVYVQSAIMEMFNMIQTYSHALQIEPWSSIGLSEGDIDRIGLDPNMELNWRNQATAHTDCLIKYREAFEFLVFTDLDEVLVPPSGRTYALEFNLLAELHPDAAGFIYMRRSAALTANKNASNFLLNETIFSMDDSDKKLRSYKSVVNSSRVETFWIHWPGNALPRMNMVRVDAGRILHLNNWLLTDGSVEAYKPPEQLLLHDPVNISTGVVQEINKKFQAHHNAHQRVYDALPSEQFYKEKFGACYRKMLSDYAQNLFNKCPSPNNCSNIGDVAGLQCVVARRKFSSRALGANFFIYTAQKEATFERRMNGCTF